MPGSPEQGRDTMPSSAASLNDQDVFLLRARGGLRIWGQQLTGENTLKSCDVFLPGDGGEAIGEHVCFAEREAGLEIGFYADSMRTTELLRVTIRCPTPTGGLWRTLASVARDMFRDCTYDVTEPDGTSIGAIKQVGAQRQYEISDAVPDTEPIIVIQEAEEVSVKQWALSARPFCRDRFAVWRGGRRLGTLVPDRARTDTTLDMTLDGERVEDRRLVLAAVCLDLLRLRNEDGGGGG